MEDFERYYNKALRFLSFRPRSEKEVRDNLLKKKAQREIIEKVISKLRKQNFINDEEFSKWWIEQRMRFKPRAERIIKFELKQKGIKEDMIDENLNDKLATTSNKELAKKLIEKRIQKYQGLEKEEVYKKLGFFLARKGFNWDTIKQSIDEIFNKRV